MSIQPFVIIGGMPRSGTTLIETVIGSHSSIAIPPGDIPFAEQYARNLSVDQIFAALRRKRTWSLWQEQDFDDLLDKPPVDAFRLAMLRYAESAGKPIPGIKSPYSEFFYETYRDWLSGYSLKFVHVIRNPLDVIASLKHSHIHTNWRILSDLVEVQSRNWQRSVLLATARRKSTPHSYFVFRYEDFVADPVGSARQISDFLGVQFEADRMMSRRDYAYFDSNSSFDHRNAAARDPGKFVYRPGSRKSHLEPGDIRTISRLCGEAARALGYEDPDLRSAPPCYASGIPASERALRKLKRLRRRLLQPQM